MSVHLSLRRFFARFQNTYEDETDEVEQHLLQPADRTDQKERAACNAMGSLRSSPQDQHLRHTQLQDIPSRKFADRQRAANDVPFGPNPDVSHSAYSAGERISGTEHADPTYFVGAAALPPSQHRSLPTAPYRQQTPSLQRSSDPVHGRLPPPPGYYYSDSPYPEPSMHNVRKRLSSPELPASSVPMEADDQGRKTSSAVRQSTTSAHREDHPQQRTFNFVDPGGGRGLFSSSFEPFDSVADREQKSAFYRNAAPCKPGPYAWKPLDIPTFDGDIRKYPRFREAFEEVYETHPDLAPRNKLLYLCMHLLGEPLAFAESYMIDDESYATVLKQLDEKYGNKGRLLVTLCHDLANIQPPSEELNDLRRFCQEVGAIQSSFRHAGETLDNSPVYEMQISTKLPKSIRLKLVDSYGYHPYSHSTTALLAALNKYVANLAWAGTELRVAEQPTDGTSVCHSVAVDTSDLGDLLCHEDPELTPIEQAVNLHRASAL